MYKHWKPRRHMVGYLALLALGFYLTAVAVLHLPDSPPSATDRLAAFDTGSSSSPGLGTDGDSSATSHTLRTIAAHPFTKCYLLLAAIANMSFAYVNYVTTVRKSPFRGAHGGFRDILVVNALIPIMVWVGLQPLSGVLFPPSTSVVAAAVPPSVANASFDAVAAVSPSTGFDGASSLPLAVPVPGALDATVGSESGATAASASIDSLAGAVAAGSAYIEQTAVLTSVAVASLHTRMEACLWLLGGTLGSLHIPYLVRAGIFDKSISAVDVANASAWTFVGIVARVLIILTCFIRHLFWAVDEGEILWRGALYLCIIGACWGITVALKDRYYFHWHHWAAGFMLFPAARLHSIPLTMILTGVCIGQIVEGAARWSVAPLWHRHLWAAWGRSLI